MFFYLFIWLIIYDSSLSHEWVSEQGSEWVSNGVVNGVWAWENEGASCRVGSFTACNNNVFSTSVRILFVLVPLLFSLLSKSLTCNFCACSLWFTHSHTIPHRSPRPPPMSPKVPHCSSLFQYCLPPPFCYFPWRSYLDAHIFLQIGVWENSSFCYGCSKNTGPLNALL